MLTSKLLYNHIDEIVENAYLGFLFMLVGADMLSDDQKRQVERLNLVIGRRPLIELLYMLIRNRPAEGYSTQFTLNHILSQAESGVLPVLNDAQQATIDTGRAAMMDAIETTKQELKKKIRQEIIDLNRQQRQNTAVKRIESISQLNERKQTLKDKLLKLIPAVMMSAQDTFDRAFSSALTDTINDVVVDSATSESLFTGVPPGKTVVYKKVIKDDRLCRWCHKFYTNQDGSPKLYSLEELQANGSNYSKPKSEWKPTLGKTHPRCRCQLFYRKVT